MRTRRHLTIYSLISSSWPMWGFKRGVLRGKLPLSLECHRVSSAGCNRDRETGRVTERHWGGHPLDTSNADDRFVVNSALWNRMMNAAQLQACLKEVRCTRVSHQTIRNSLHQHGLRARQSAMVPDHFTRHKRHRLAWAREHLHWTRNQWASILFSDESRFPLNRSEGRQCCWRCQRECYASAIVVWCYFLGRTALHLVNGTVTSQYYLKKHH